MSLTEASQKRSEAGGSLTHSWQGSKVVVMVAHVDTRATVTQVRTKLSSLDKTMKAMDSDI
jgi:carbamoylphosphate synthase small subunit